MPTLTINEQTVTVSDGTTIIQAAETLGIEIPRYCYHPGLPVAGSCRMCLVEIEKMPKLQPACNTRVSEGMVVRTNSEKVKKAVSGVLEFLLVNHPLDCPVCDQAGECYLQEYYMKFGLYDSRMDEDKIKRHKAEPIGPHVILDTERCVLCSRCVRFVKEVSKSHELGIFNRGSRSEIRLLPGKTLDSNYSGNVVDICPVGALLDRDFRFQCRVWYLEQTPSVCPGCSRGCNINIHVNRRRPHHAEGRRVVRLKPRYNPQVNQWWMCDEGRYGYKSIDDPARLLYPQVKQDGEFCEVSWWEALELAGKQLTQALRRGRDSVVVLPSAQLTNEDLFLIRKFFGEDIGVTQIDFMVPDMAPKTSDDFLLREDKNPNTAGAIAILRREDAFSLEKFLEAPDGGKLAVLYLIEHDVINSMGDAEALKLLDRFEYVIFQGSHSNLTSAHADLILPSAVYAEADGTFTNFEGRVQRIQRAVEPIGSSLPVWEGIRNLARTMGYTYSCSQLEEIFGEIAGAISEFQGLSYERIAGEGAVWTKPTQGQAEP